MDALAHIDEYPSTSTYFGYLIRLIMTFELAQLQVYTRTKRM